MAQWMSLPEAISTHVSDGQTLALEGFTHLIPFAAGHEILRQGRRDLALIRMTPDLLYDQMIGAGAVRKLTFSWGGNPGVGSLHRLRDASEHGWPAPIELDEHSHAAMAHMWAAGAAGLPFAALRAYQGTDLARVNPNVRTVTCPFTAEVLAAVPAHRPDVGIVHAQRADARGNVLVEGIVGVHKEVVLASAVSIVTVEERVEDLRAPSLNSVVLPGWAIDAVVEAPRGAWPSYAHGYYPRDNAFYTSWDAISRDRGAFEEWLQQHVHGGAA
ncbi:MAG: CoA transferase subunit A [Myxococcales bacterium]|nr:CoA transferase subunit A [Myxococcales bacterium]